MRKLLKVLFASAAMLAIACAAAYAIYTFITRDAILDEKKLTDYSKSITVCDTYGDEITSASLSARRRSVRLGDLEQDTVNAFIASEDRDFYRHNGLNYKRMLKALISNISSRSFAQGASTISQQLIKNTHLTGDKTISRKLKEIKLTKKLEKKYTKEEILEMYLNTIYFGHNCYGLESAAEFYFGTTADKLSLTQSATLAGLLTSPNNFSPYKNPEKCLKRRNTVLKCMAECGFIDQKTCEKAEESALDTAQNGAAQTNAGYLYGVFNELEKLNMDDSTLLSGCKVITYLEKDLQSIADRAAEDCSCAIIVTSQEGGVRAYRSDIRGAKRQPGSTIKPLLVYGPAIEEKIICPATKILDEKVNFGGYSPENYDKKYHGYVTAAESLAKSYNIPAIKTLNTLTVSKAEKYAEKMGIELSDDEKNLSLALGGMKYGLSLEEICEKYRAFAGGGAYTPTKFIKEIVSGKGKILYRATGNKKQVFSQGTASLMNSMLKESVESGTARRLKGLKADIAAKTGTCGNEKGNTDAYCIAYTSRDCIGVWLGDAENRPLDITGSGDCCEIAKSIFEKMYSSPHDTPAPLDTKSGTKTIRIDRDEYNANNKIIAADSIAPLLTTKEISILEDDSVSQYSTRFSSPEIEKPAISVQNDTVFIRLCQTYYYAYLIKRQNEDREITVYEGPWKAEIFDKVQKGKYTYTVTPYYTDGVKKYFGQKIVLPSVNISGSLSPQNNNGITSKDWFLE